jgi:quercetin 2,3-dioxygenase
MSGPVTPTDAPPDEAGEGAAPPCVERHRARETDVGGIPVRRALPKRVRRSLGAWCFVDHFGPVTGSTARMEVGPHPHIGLQTVTWLVDGEVLHRDSLGFEQPIRPGQVNLMTAGRGVAHAEETPTGAPEVLHGAQLWIAQPDATRDGDPAFEHHAELPVAVHGDARSTVLIGELDGHRSPARAHTPLVGASVALPAGGRATVPLREGFEHGLVVLVGRIQVGDEAVVPGELAYLGTGRAELPLAGGDEDAVVLLLGGTPFEATPLMWWNFVARTRDEIGTAWQAWQEHHDRFGTVASPLDRIDAPTPPWLETRA